MSDLDEIFSDELLVRLNSSRRNRPIDEPSVVCRGTNPLCGDEVEFEIRLSGERVEDITFKASGCMLSVAGADAVCELCAGRSVGDVLNLSEDEIAELLPSVIGIRKRCALLGLETIRKKLRTTRP